MITINSLNNTILKTETNIQEKQGLLLVGYL